MNYLERKVLLKKKEVARQKNKVDINRIIKSEGFNRTPVSLVKAIKAGSGIIGEFKRRSPSAGYFNSDGNLKNTLELYQDNKVSGFSILTDESDFGGNLEDLKLARELVKGPVLRKDFIVNEYQIFEAKAAGADAILLIADALDEFHCENLSILAKTIGLEVLMEFHSKSALSKLNKHVDIVGINNRNLKTLKTDLKTAQNLIKYLPYEVPKISESGISNYQEILDLVTIGYDGVLVGEFLLKNQEDLDLRSLNGSLIKIKSEKE